MNQPFEDPPTQYPVPSTQYPVPRFSAHQFYIEASTRLPAGF